MPLSDVDYYVETLIAEKLSMINGVAQVQVYGSQQYAIRILIDPIALAANQLVLNEVADAISSNNTNLPTGSLDGKNIYSSITAPGQLKTAKEYNNLILMYRNNSPIFLKNIGKAVDSVENNKVISWFNNKRGIILAIQKQPDTNTIEVIDLIRKTLPLIHNQLPKGLNVDILFDRSISIRESLKDVGFTLILSFILVVLIIFLFFNNFYTSIIPVLTLPLSIIGTFGFMYLLGYSIDNLSLMALTLSVGFIVDDAIVVLENITRHYEHTKNKFLSCLKGTNEIISTVISMTLSLIAVFIPLLMLSGILGKLLHEFAVTITIVILISGIISLTITPALCNLFLHINNNDAQEPSISDKIFLYIKEIYGKSLKKVMNHKKTVIGIFFCLTLVNIYFFIIVPKGFLPTEDSGMLIATTQANDNISFESMIEQQKYVMNILMNDSNIQDIASSVGASGRNSSMNQGSIFITLKPYGQRPKIEEILKELRAKVNNFPRIKVFIQNIPTINIGGQSSKSQYQYTLQGTDKDELFQFVTKFVEKLQTTEGFTDVNSDLHLSQPQALVKIDRFKAANFGVSIEQIQNILYNAFGSQQISTIYASTDQYPVIIGLDPKYQLDSTMLSTIHVKSSTNVLIPLSNIAEIINTAGPLSISHFGQLPSVTISFNLSPNFSLNEVIPKLESAASDLEMPASITGSFQGAAQAFQSFIGDATLLVGLAIIVIYIILGILYESFIHPLTILSGLPTASFGAILTLIFFNKELDIYGFVGLIMLLGIVKKNAIIIINFTLKVLREGKKNAQEAVYEACLVRFRPIMMTTLAALMGAIPIALGLGATGSEKSSLGLVVVGGLLTSQILTLYITPVIFLYFEDLKNKLSNAHIND